MTFGAAIKQGLGNLTNFKDRATRSEFWWYYLFISLLGIPIAIIVMMVGAAMLFPALSNVDPDTGAIPDEDVGSFLAALGVFYGLLFVFGLASFFLILAMWVRRLHDAGYSGHWLWLSLVGLSIVPLIFAFLDSQNGANRWGADPKAAERAAWAGIAVPYAAPPPPIAQPYGQPPLAPPPYNQSPPPAAASGEYQDPFAAPPR